MKAVVSTLITAPYSEQELSAMSELWRKAVSTRGLRKATEEKVITETSLGDAKELRQIIIRLCHENHPVPIIVKVTGSLENRFVLEKWYYEDNKAGKKDEDDLIEFVVYRTKVPLPKIHRGMSEEELRAYVEKKSARKSPLIPDPWSVLPSLEVVPINEEVDSDSDVEVLCRIFGKDTVRVVQAAQQYIRLQKLHFEPDSYNIVTNIVGSAVKFFSVQDEFA